MDCASGWAHFLIRASFRRLRADSLSRRAMRPVHVCIQGNISSKYIFQKSSMEYSTCHNLRPVFTLEKMERNYFVCFAVSSGNSALGLQYEMNEQIIHLIFVT